VKFENKAIEGNENVIASSIGLYFIRKMGHVLVITEPNESTLTLV